MKKQQANSRAGWAILLLLAGTLAPLAGSVLASLLAPSITGVVSLVGYALTALGAALLLPDSRWFALTVLFAVLGMLVDSLPLRVPDISGQVLYVLTALATAFCYAAVYGGMDIVLTRAGADAAARRLGLWWIACFGAGETLMYIALFAAEGELGRMLSMAAGFACTVCALVYQVRYLLCARKRVA